MHEILKAFDSIDRDLIESLTKDVLERYRSEYPEIDFDDERNVDFIVRPAVAAILLADIAKGYGARMSTVDGIASSSMPDDEK